MSTNETGGPRPKRTHTSQRQLTIGECTAIARYAPHYIDEHTGQVHLPDVLRLVDRLQVCTTCGWPRAYHDLPADSRAVLTCCPQWTRQR